MKPPPKKMVVFKASSSFLDGKSAIEDNPADRKNSKGYCHIFCLLLFSVIYSGRLASEVIWQSETGFKFQKGWEHLIHLSKCLHAFKWLTLCFYHQCYSYTIQSCHILKHFQHLSGSRQVLSNGIIETCQQHGSFPKQCTMRTVIEARNSALSAAIKTVKTLGWFNLVERMLILW